MGATRITNYNTTPWLITVLYYCAWERGRRALGKYRRTQEGSRLYSSFQTLETSTVSRQILFWESLGSMFSHRPAGEKVRLTKHFVRSA